MRWIPPALAALVFASPGWAQEPGGPPLGRGGPPGMGAERKLLEEFDADDNGWLDRAERDEARKKAPAQSGRGPGGGPGGRGGPPGMGRRMEPAAPGAKLAPADVQPETGPLYDPAIYRTLFLDFESEDWQAELEAFNNSDVDVPARLTVDGRTYEGVGVHFRGASSYFMVPSGSKRSLNLALDLVNEDQTLDGFKTLNLLNANGDPSFLRAVLYLDIARNFLPAARANFVRVVINGENWGLYTNAEQINKGFVASHFDFGKGTRWKVPGSPMGRGGLEYLGDDPGPYKQIYTIKNNDKPESWQRLIELCRVLNETPLEELPTALEPLLDVDGVLRFLAIENALINSDGYWIRASDYYLYLDEDNRFHLIPHDVNEAMAPSMGPPGGGRGGMNRGPAGGGRDRQGPPAGRENGPPEGGPPGEGPPPAGFGPPDGFGPPEGGPPRGFGPPQEGPPQRGPGGRAGNGVALDPLVGMTDKSKPLRSRLLAVPVWREQYLGYVREIAEKYLDWEWLGPRVAQYAEKVGPWVEQDTKKLSSLADFRAAVSPEPLSPPSAEGETGARGAAGPGRGGARPQMSLRGFADARRAFLLKYQPPAEPAGNR